MKDRHTARALLLDNQNRILLICFEMPVRQDPERAPSMETFWATVGGAMDPGESFEQALRREIYEETGLTERDVEISQAIWCGEHEVFFAGEVMRFIERFAVARVGHSCITLRGFTQGEKQAYRAHKWWSLEELRASSEVIYPPNLPGLLAPILAGELPPEPVEIEL